MQFAESSLQKTMAQYAINRSKTFNDIEEAIDKAVAAGTNECWVSGAIGKEEIKHIKEKGYKIKVYCREGKGDDCFEAGIHVSW